MHVGDLLTQATQLVGRTHSLLLKTVEGDLSDEADDAGLCVCV